MPDTNPNNPASQVDTTDLTARTMQQAKAELPQPKAPALSDALAEPAPAAPSTSKIGKAYDAMKSWLGEHEENLSEKHLAPFRQGLDNMAADLEEAGESGHTKSGGALSGPTRALASGAGFMLRQVPIGKNAKETAAMALAPELPEGHMFEGLRVRPLEQIGEEVAEKSVAKAATKEKPTFRHTETTPVNNESGQPFGAFNTTMHDKSGKEVGNALVGLNGDGTANINDTGIKEELRNQGHGKELYRQAIEKAKEYGAHTVRSGGPSEDAARVWKSLGKEYPVTDRKNGGFEIKFPKSVSKNASGESAASQEAINRAASQKSQGVTHVRRDTRSGKEIPMSSVDATDAKAGPYDQIVQKHANGETILDSGAKARPVSGQPKTAGAQVSPKPFAKSGDKKEVSKLASDYLVTLKKSVN